MSQPLDDLILQVKKLRLEKNLQIGALNAQIIELTRQRDELAEPFNTQEKDLIEEFSPYVLAHGASYKNEVGTIQFTRGYTTRKWDLDALDDVCSRIKAVRERIWELRHETQVPPRFTVKTG